MNSIRKLATQWFNILSFAEKIKLIENTKKWDSLTGLEIENIFYNEVIVKWFEAHSLYELCKTMAKDQIIAAYLKEHSKEELYINKGLDYTIDLEQPLSVNKDVELDGEYPTGTIVRDMYNLVEDEFDKPCYTKLKDGKWGLGSQKYFSINKGSIGEGKRFKLISIPPQPKVEDNSWDEIAKVLSNTKYRLPLSKSDTAVYAVDITKAIEILKEHYTLIKK